MQVLEIAALIAGGFTLLRFAVSLPLVVRYFRRARVHTIPRGETPPMSVLVPLYGADPGLEQNLEGLLRQNYPDFEVLFLHEVPDDPALAAARAAAERVPDVPVRYVQGRTDAVNPKVAVLARGQQEARHDILVSVDADVRPDALYLRDVANGLMERDIVGFPPVLFGMQTAGARMLALFVNIEGFTALLVGRGLWIPGATIGVRRAALQSIGGYQAVGDRMADDADLAAALRRAGHPAVLSRRAARCYTPGGSLRETAVLMARWARTVRGAAPVLYAVGFLPAFAPLLLLATALLSPHGVLALAAFALHNAMRIGLSVAIDLRFCWDRSMLRSLRMLPLTWFAEPLVWLAGLWGRTVVWRGRTYRLRGGRVSLAAP